MELRRGRDGFTLRVRDDGIGFDLTQPAAEGLGLDSMRERLGAVGGTLQIESAPKRGTYLQAFVSLGRADRESEY